MTAAETSPTYPDSVYNIVPSGTKWVVQKALSDHSWMYLGRYASRDAASNAVSADKKAPASLYSLFGDVDSLATFGPVPDSYRQNKFIVGYRKTARSGYEGVFKIGNRWKAQASSRDGAGKKQYLGIFSTKEEAAVAVAAYKGISIDFKDAQVFRMAPRQLHLSRQKGVRKYNSMWRAESSLPGCGRKHIGVFKTKDEAIEAVKSFEDRIKSHSDA